MSQGLESQSVQDFEETTMTQEAFETQDPVGDSSPEVETQSAPEQKSPHRKKKHHNNRRRNGQNKQHGRHRNKPAREPQRDLAALEEEDEFFGNRKDYVPMGGSGVDGYYREPMSNGRGNYSRYQQRHGGNQQQQYTEADGVLSIRLPGWQERINKSENEQQLHDQGILTMRQQNYNNRNGNGQDRRHERSRDPERMWQKTMDDIRTGRYKEDGRNNKRRRRNNKRRHQNSTNSSN